jgi:hypothetical protein
VPPFTVIGPTHANGDIYVGSIRPLTFNSLVTKTGTISSPAWFGHQVSDYTGAVTYRAGQVTIPSPLNLPIGTNNTPAAVREIINLPPTGEDPNSPLGQQRYYNKARVVLLVSNSTVTVTLKNSPWDPAPTIITANYYPTNSSPTNYLQVTTNFPFLALTNTFTDQRENVTIKATDIDMSKLKKWLVTNAAVNAKFPNAAGVYDVANAPNILYVADNRTNGSFQLTAVRLKNGQIIPTNLVAIASTPQPSGFTVTTPNPLYVWGHYNCPDNTTLGTINTTAAYPASLVSDALTLLSPNWQDSHSNDPFGPGVRVASSTTVNAAILAGVVYSTGSGATQYSGGVHNLPRLLEDWGNGSASVVLTLNTSFVNLFNSARATSQWRIPGNYYYAPTRQFSFNLSFLDATRLPPGTPLLDGTRPFATAAAVLTVPPSSTGNQFQFSLTGLPGLNYAIEASTNLVDWMPIATNTSPFTFVDGDATNFPARYYRSVYLP